MKSSVERSYVEREIRIICNVSCKKGYKNWTRNIKCEGIKIYYAEFYGA